MATSGLTRKILSPMQMAAWPETVAYHTILQFIGEVNSLISGQPCPVAIPEDCSLNLKSLVNLLNKLNQKIDQIPPVQQSQRFGNASFREWLGWLDQSCAQLLRDTFSDSLLSNDEEMMAEVAGYFSEAFGNGTRIDYGTGHELAFITFLICLFKTGVLRSQRFSPEKKPELPSASITTFPAATPTGTPKTAGEASMAKELDLRHVGLMVLPAYLELVRKLQLTYRMEPAGSHGVWCLDDFQFVPFIWGSAQLIGSNEVFPSDIGSLELAEMHRTRFLFFSCIHYIFQCKTGPFAEHSGTLFSLTKVPHWQKINTGMIKMYIGEVLSKFPVVQHCLFGKLLPFERRTSGSNSTATTAPERGGLATPSAAWQK